jgi:hypothetical protein
MCKVYDAFQRLYVAIGPNSLHGHELGRWGMDVILTRSSGDMRPSGTTAVASTTIAPTPREAKPWQNRQGEGCSEYKKTRNGTNAEVDEMPISGMPSVGAVLTHGGLTARVRRQVQEDNGRYLYHPYPVLEGDVFYHKWLE